jgi:hypothetical protein
MDRAGHAVVLATPAVALTTRRHVDLLRVTAAACRMTLRRPMP